MESIYEKNERRIKIAERMGKPDKVPFLADALGNFIAGFVGVDQREYHLHPKIMLKSQLKVRERFWGLLCRAVSPDFGVALEPALLGGKVIWRVDQAPFIEPVIHDLEEIDELKVRDPTEVDSIAKAIDTYKYFKSSAPQEVPVDFHGAVLGPIDTAALLRGISNFMVDLHKNPDTAHALLEKASDACIKLVELHTEFVGELDRFSVNDDYAAFLSPKMFKEFVIPYTQKIYKILPKKTIRWWHSDGTQIGPCLELLPEMGVQVFHSFTYKIDLAEAKAKIGDRVCLSGNINPINVIRDGSPFSVLRACEEAIKKGAPGGGYILEPGGELGRGTPPENIDAMILAVAEYGTYPTE